ncbi:hypothetical protein HPB51_014914 [Rhipicephalus microplus]|uniref:CCHC-type domain-containing protein n=1 Tax=Rhipicephalus microplus TaxID=6941 RepID=A0A9J6EGR5_RHIMP|nr:hypothetical protein HPB51_014914 [Rhipicephalus microplus]
MVEKWLQASPVAPTQALMPASQCASGATPATSGACATGTAEELPQSPTQTEAPGQTEGPAGVPLPLSYDEDDEAIDFQTHGRGCGKRVGMRTTTHYESKRPLPPFATTPSESSEEESHTSQGSEELSGSECRTTVNSEVASTTADMTSSATTGGTDSASSDGAGTCQLPTTVSTDDLSAPGNPCPPSPHTEELPLPATSPQGVESTLPAPAAEGATESPDNPPPDASAAMEVEEEVLTSTAAGGNTRQEAPYTAKDFLLTPSAGATPTNRRKKGKKKPTKKQPPVTASEGTAANIPQPFGKAPTAVDTTRRHSSAAGSPPDTEGFQEVTTRGARRRARDLAAAAALPVDPAFVGTVLFRTSAPGVRLARPRPLQCRQCGRFGHVKESCSWPGSCIRCGRTHPGESCKQTWPWCVNCGGPHSADTPECPRWQEQRKVATIMVSSPTILSRRAVAVVYWRLLKQDTSSGDLLQLGLVGGAGRQAAPGGEIITPHRFRSFISKKGNHRFFRRSCQEFGTDVVSEEMPDDNEVLSLGGQDPRHAHFGDNNSSNYQLRFPTEKAWRNSADKAPHSPLRSQEFRVDPRKHCIWLRPGRRDGSWIRVAAQPSSRRNDCSIPPLPPVVKGGVS